MRRILTAILFVLALSLPGGAGAEKITLPADTAVEVNFSPSKDITKALIARIDVAEKTILVLAYGFTHPDIGAALVRAHARGVDVEIILDSKANRTNKNSQAQAMVAAGIPVEFDAQHPIAHNKVMVIDGKTVATGSFNFTPSAEKNGENNLIIDSPDLARIYEANWREHRGHAE